MSKYRKNINYLVRSVLVTFEQTKTFIFNKYYNIYMNDLDIIGVDYQQKDYILKMFWADGTISGFLLEGTKGSTENPSGLPVFCQYAPTEYNLYDWPIKATPVNKRGVKFIPNEPLLIDKEIVIGYAQRTKKPIYYVVEYYAKKIALCETAIQTQVLAQKMPFLLGTSPDNKAKMENLMNALLDDFPGLFVDADDINTLKVLIAGSNYTVDKLYQLKTAYENELRETLGFSNLGVSEKKEHLVTDEIEANNEITEANGSIIIDCLNEFADQFNKVFGYNLKFIWKESKEVEKEEAEDDLEEEEQI